MNKKEISYGFYPYLCSLFTTIVIAGNIFALKLTIFFGFITPSGMICFPCTYALGNIITEVYGYKKARQIILISMLNLVCFYLLLRIVIHLPPASGWLLQNEFESVFDMSLRLFLGTLAGYLGGELINSRAISILKYITVGKIFIPRSFASTLIGITLDTLLFNLVAFVGVYPLKSLYIFISHQYFLKLGFELIGAVPAYLIMRYIKYRENMDVYDVYNFRWIAKYKKYFKDDQSMRSGEVGYD